MRPVAVASSLPRARASIAYTPVIPCDVPHVAMAESESAVRSATKNESVMRALQVAGLMYDVDVE